MNPVAAFYLIFFGLIIPWSVFRNRKRAAQPLTKPRYVYFRGVVVQQIILGAFATLVAWYLEMPRRVGRIDLVSLEIAMMVHAGYDLAAGYNYGKLKNGS